MRCGCLKWFPPTQRCSAGPPCALYGGHLARLWVPSNRALNTALRFAQDRRFAIVGILLSLSAVTVKVSSGALSSLSRDCASVQCSVNLKGMVSAIADRDKQDGKAQKPCRNEIIATWPRRWPRRDVLIRGCIRPAGERTGRLWGHRSGVDPSLCWIGTPHVPGANRREIRVNKSLPESDTHVASRPQQLLRTLDLGEPVHTACAYWVHPAGGKGSGQSINAGSQVVGRFSREAQGLCCGI